jgi:hypothetical protein
MTPKEKALELIEKFKINDYDWIAQGNLYCVKQHVLITVDEILRSHHNLYGLNNKEVKFYLEVQQEIEKL